MANVIRLGDATSHGGKVEQCKSGNFKAGGKPMATVGDGVSCPIDGHQNSVIVSGNARHKINGAAVAYDGDKTSCGAALISSISNFSLK